MTTRNLEASSVGLLTKSPSSSLTLIGIEDGDKVGALCRLMGCALLTALDALERAGQLKKDSDFLDLPLVITSFLHWAVHLPRYGIEGDDVEWVSKAVDYFQKAELNPKKGMTDSDTLIQKCIEGFKDEEEDDDNEDEEIGNGEGPNPKKSSEDPWGWSHSLKVYKKENEGVFATKQYDITRMSKKERAASSFNGRDPLAGISAKDLREGNLDFD